MNCKEAKSLMVFYETCTLEEQSAIRKHFSNCAACSIIFSGITEQKEIIEQAKNWTPEISDPVVFTNQVMAGLSKRNERKTRPNIFGSIFQWSPLQTSLAGCSVFLALTFVIEFFSMSKPLQPQSIVRNGVTLSSNQEQLIQAKRTRTARFSLEKVIQQENTVALFKIQE